MNKSVLEKLKCKAREKKLEKKTKVFRKKKVEKERVE